MEPNFPGNSQRPPRPQQDEKKIEPVVVSKVQRRKTPLGRRVSQNFIGGDVQGSWGSVVAEILVPAGRELVYNMFQGFFERVIFPDSVPNRGRMRGGPTNYAAPFSHRGSRVEQQRGGGPRRGRTSYDIDDFVFQTRVEALEVQDRLEHYLDKYGQVSVADLLSLVGEPSNHVDTNWGWTDLTYSQIRHSGDGYLLIMPRPESFK